MYVCASVETLRTIASMEEKRFVTLDLAQLMSKSLNL